MCGIAGLFNIEKKVNIDVDFYIKNILNENLLSHRGPDSNGYWVNIDRNILLMHTRLSIQDLSDNGKQPMISSDDRYVITYNGEIYNKFELANLLNIPSKSKFVNSDTRLLLEIIVRKGLLWALSNVVGMFSFSLWDKKDKLLYLAVDRNSEKPLYYSFRDNKLFFCSELKAFEQINWIKNLEINYQSKDIYFLLGYIPAPLTIWKGIYKLKPGSLISFVEGQSSPTEINYADQEQNNDYEKYVNSNLKNGKVKSLISSALEKSVERHLISDVPCGVFLSGGVDSSLITALSSKFSNNKLKTFSVGFKSSSFDESHYAKKVSRYFSTEHYSILFNKDDFLRNLNLINSIFDEPFGDPSALPTIEIAKIASKKVKVILGGEGADEIFGGYSRYFSKKKKLIFDFLKLNSSYYLKFIKNFYKSGYATYSLSRKSKLLNIISDSNPSLSYMFLNSFWNRSLSDDIKETLRSYSDYYEESLFHKSYLNFAMMIDKKLYLPGDLLTKLDRSCMAFSLESRTPFLDKDLISLVSIVPNSYFTNSKRPKFLLKDILSDYLPSEMIERSKQGFTLPLSEWLISKEIKDLVSQLFTKEQLELAGFEFNYIKKIWNQFCEKPSPQYVDSLWLLIVYLNWQKAKFFT